MAADDYEIGFGKPPKRTRFKPGQSGNPLGRPKGSKNIPTLFRSILGEKVRVKMDHGYASISKLEAAFTQVVNKAASGDLKAFREIVRLPINLLQEPEADGPIILNVEFVESDGKGRPKKLDPENTGESLDED